MFEKTSQQLLEGQTVSTRTFSVSIFQFLLLSSFPLGETRGGEEEDDERG